MKNTTDPNKRTLEDALALLRKSNDTPFIQVLEAVASAFECEVATYWIFDSKIQALRESRSWYSSPSFANQLWPDVSKRHFMIGEGIPGFVWKERKPFISNDIQMDVSLPRSIGMHSAGLVSGYWFPVLTEQAVVGVMELFGKDRVRDPEAVLRILETFSSGSNASTR
ncbi:MAG: GAF domain-containing protein [Bdellovibrionales bacterium]